MDAPKMWKSPSTLVLAVHTKGSEEIEKHAKETGTSLEEKLKRATASRERAVADLKLFGIEEMSPEAKEAVTQYVIAEGLRAHYQAQMDKAAAEKAAREEEAKRLKAIQDTVALLAAKLGTLDPTKIREALVSAGLVEAPKPEAPKP